MAESHSPIKSRRIGLKFWLWVKPVISEFHKLPRWLRTWAGWGFIGAALAMVGIGEYAVAEALLIPALVAFGIQIYDWQGIDQGPRLTRTIKAAFLVGVIVMLMFFAMVFLRQKGTKPWSNLSDKHDQEQLKRPTPTPSPIPSMSPTPVASPSASPSVQKAPSKRPNKTELQRSRDQALRDLDYRKP
jgi:hypothetical protein